jgi:acetyl esterase/lipase
MQTLNMDIYQPYNDPMQARPFMVLVHGGSFLQGSKADLEETCRAFARKGYVAVSIQYRLGYSSFTAAGAVQTVIRATQDLKNAVRFLRKSVTLSNPYKLHPDYAFVGGVSAGAITSLHAAYMDQLSEILPGQTIPSLDSLHDAGQIPGFDWRFKAVINIAGGIGDTNWIQPGDVPVTSFQGTADAVVPYETGSFSGAFSLFGSHPIYLRTQNLGIRSELRPFVGAGHDYSAGNPGATDTTIARITSFLLPFLVSPATGAENMEVKNPVRVFMQPDGWQVETSMPGFEMKLYDFQGRVLQQKSEGSASLSISAATCGRVLLITTKEGMRKSWMLPANQH